MVGYILSPRMQVITGFAEKAKIVADIGCDHGKISVELAKGGAHVYAVDISQPSLQKARELAKAEKVEQSIEFYCANGLDDIKHIQLDAIIIAGMGWRMIGEILDNNIECVKNAKKLILQPMDNVIELRRYLCSSNYKIMDEKLVIDEGRLYTVICTEHGKHSRLSRNQLLLGPKVIENNDSLIPELAKRELKKKKIKLAGLLMATKHDKKMIRRTKKDIKILRRYIKE